MIELDSSKFKLRPYAHQLAGVKTLLRKPVYGLFWKPRLGKTKAVIDAACGLFEAKEIDTVVIVCPAQVKDVWLDDELGEIKKHCWVNYETFNYCARKEHGLLDVAHNDNLTFIVASYEFLRQESATRDFPKVDALSRLLRLRRASWVVADETNAIANVDSLQFKAMMQLRPHCDRATALCGTPAGNSPMDLFGQFTFLDRDILGYRNFWQFKANHAVVERQSFRGRKPFNKVVSYKNLDLLTSKTEKFCEYLDKGVDLPTKVPSLLSVPLSAATWKVYKTLRDKLIVELETGENNVVQNSVVKVMRLAQVCAGLAGGFVEMEEPTQRISKEVGESLVRWVGARLADEPKFKAVIWSRWRMEIKWLVECLMQLPIAVGQYWGDKKTVNFLHPDGNFDGAGIMVAQPAAAQFGITFAKADTVVYASHDYNLVQRAQSEERVQAPGLRQTTLMVDVLVTGPDGQRTVTHDIVRSLANKEDIAKRTVDRWRKVLSDE